jgi:hypothetical protein
MQTEQFMCNSIDRVKGTGTDSQKEYFKELVSEIDQDDTYQLLQKLHLRI